MRKNVYSNSPWEEKVAYSRATRIGKHIFVSGTVAVDENGEVVGKGDLYQQAKYIFQKIRLALKKLDADYTDVVRTRMYILDFADMDAISKAHHEVFAGIDPASSCVAVPALVGKDFLIEIEVEAVLSD